MKHHCVNLGMAQKCSKYVKTMSTQFYTCLYVTLTYSTRKPVQRKTFRFQNACTMLHKSTDGVKTCLCYLCFISASFLALDKPYHRTHHVIDARLFSSSAPLKAFTKPLNQSCSICNGDLKEFDPWNGALWHCQREHVRGSISWCHQGAYLPSCLRLENLFDAGTNHRPNHILPTWMSKEIANNLQGMHLFCPLPGASLSAYCSTGNSLTLKFT